MTEASGTAWQDEFLYVPSEYFLGGVRRWLSQSPAANHPFLSAFAQQTLTLPQVVEFAVQWYKAARLHKMAFPALVWNTRRDDVRFGLIDILYEEYGSGDESRIHAVLLERFLRALGISDSDVENSETMPEVEQFAALVLKTWTESTPATAFGCHFALEVIATRLHSSFAEGLLKRPDFTREALEYFSVHRGAEPRHVSCSESGVMIYSGTALERRELADGVALGESAVRVLLDGLGRAVFQTCN